MPTNTEKIEPGDLVILEDFIGFVVCENSHTYTMTDGEVEREFSKTANIQIISNAYALAHMMYKRLKGVQ